MLAEVSWIFFCLWSFKAFVNEGIHLQLTILVFNCTMSLTSFLSLPFQACAPRYVYHQHQPKKVERIEPVGTCFIARDNFKEYQEYSPCRTSEFPLLLPDFFVSKQRIKSEIDLVQWRVSSLPKSCEIQSIEGCTVAQNRFRASKRYFLSS